MEKVLVNLYVPSLGQHFDILIPTFLKIAELVPLVSSMLEELSNFQYASSSHELLCSLDQDLILRQDYSLKDYDVQNGEHLMLS